MALTWRGAPVDPAELVAQVAESHRDLLLRVHRNRLRWEDLEDCYSQATLELVGRARRSPFESSSHAQNALEQKFVSRIDDRRRAIGGRSAIECALAGAASVDAPGSRAAELADPGAELLRQVSGRIEVRRLREVARELTADQRLVLACQLSLNMDCAEFCDRFGWSSEKFRKVAQRGRARLRVLVDEYQLGERCLRIADDLNAVSAGVATTEQIERAGAHIENCRSCARRLHQLDRAARQVAALLPAPFGVKAALAAVVWGMHRLIGGRQAGAAGVAGGGVGAAKLGGAVAVCVAGAAACAHTGLLAVAVKPAHPRHVHVAVPALHVPAPGAAGLARAAPQGLARRYPVASRRRVATDRHAAAAALTRHRVAPRQDFGFEVHASPALPAPLPRARQSRTDPSRARSSRAGPEFSLER